MSFSCLPNCGACCGPVPIPRAVLNRYRDRIQVPPQQVEEHDLGNGQVLPVTQDNSCVFLDRITNSCRIYEDRPELCRSFGISKEPRLQCPCLFPDGRTRPRAGRRKLERAMMERDERLMEIAGAKQ